MKTKYKFINFKEIQKDTSARPIYNIFNNKSNEELGGISYYHRWKQYVFYINPEADAIFNDSCLLDIVDFIKQLKGLGK